MNFSKLIKKLAIYPSCLENNNWDKYKDNHTQKHNRQIATNEEDTILQAVRIKTYSISGNNRKYG